MKNATRYCAGPAYYRMCSPDVYCSKQTGSSSTKKTITHHFFVSGIGQKKLSMQPKFVAAQKNVVKNRNPASYPNGLPGFITRHLYLLEGRVYCSIIAWAAQRWATPSAPSLIYSSFQLFLHMDQPLSEGWNNPAQRCLPVGGRLYYPRRRRWVFHALTDRLLWCANRRRPLLIIMQDHFQL